MPTPRCLVRQRDSYELAPGNKQTTWPTLAVHAIGKSAVCNIAIVSPFFFQDPSKKYLHYVDSAVKFQVRSGLEDLPERIEISLISEIATGTCAPPPNVLRDQSDLHPTQSIAASPLSFSLLSAHEGSLADLIAPDQGRWADWTDGFNMLRRDGGHLASKETAGFVQALTDIGLKIKLLGA